jgi:hypothetical protein
MSTFIAVASPAWLTNLITSLDRHSGSAMALLTLIYVVATLLLVYVGQRQLSQSVALERNRTRPVVVFELLVEHYFVHLSIRNYGQSVARNIKITIEPELRILLGGKGFEGVVIDPPDESDESIPLLKEGITSLAPGREIKGEIGYIQRFQQHYSETKFTGWMRYESPDGTEYRDRFSADLLATRRLGQIQRYDIHDVAEALRSVRSELERIKTRLYLWPIPMKATDAKSPGTAGEEA